MQHGYQSPAEEELIDTISLDQYLIRNPDATLLVPVRGNSLATRGIHSGDIVIVERGKKARWGDIVLALSDGEWKLHQLEFWRKKEIVIRGVVVAVVRKYY